MVSQSLEGVQGVVVAASDYVKVLPDTARPWLEQPMIALGTDGFGRSESREALRDHFEVDARHVVAATLSVLAREEVQIDVKVVQAAFKDLGIDPEKPNPAHARSRRLAGHKGALRAPRRGAAGSKTWMPEAASGSTLNTSAHAVRPCRT